MWNSLKNRWASFGVIGRTVLSSPIVGTCSFIFFAILFNSVGNNPVAIWLTFTMGYIAVMLMLIGVTSQIFKTIDAQVVPGSEHLIGVVIELKTKARSLRRVGNAILLAIALCLLGGAYVFGQAETRATVNQAELEFLKDARDRAESDYRGAKNKLDEALKVDSGRASIRVESLTKKHDEALANFRIQEAKLGQIFSKEKQSSDSLSIYLVSLLSTKIGTVVLVLLFVQILANLHRYLMRLATFYDARSYMLQLMPNAHKLSVVDLQKLFGTDSIDFGKPPKPLTETFVEAVTTTTKRKTKGLADSKPVGKDADTHA